MIKAKNASLLLAFVTDFKHFKKINSQSRYIHFYKIENTTYYIGIDAIQTGSAFAFFKSVSAAGIELRTCDLAEIFAVSSRELFQKLLFNIEQFAHYENHNTVFLPLASDWYNFI